MIEQSHYVTPREIINRLCSATLQADICACLGDLITHLSRRGGRAFARAAIRATLESFGGLLSGMEFDRYCGGYTMIQPRNAFRVLSALSLYLADPLEVMGTVRQTLELISSFQKATTTPLAPEEIHAVLGGTRLPHCIRVASSWRPLLVFRIDAAEPIYNSSYLSGINAIIASAPQKDRRQWAKQALLHELGHAIQVALTKTPFEVPRSFFPVYEATSGRDIGSTSMKDLSEVFADTFSIAASYETELQAANPLCQVFPRWIQCGLSRYFDVLTGEALKNMETLAQRAWDLSWTQASWSEYTKFLTGCPGYADPRIALRDSTRQSVGSGRLL